jgi:hypothetical protein
MVKSRRQSLQGKSPWEGKVCRLPSCWAPRSQPECSAFQLIPAQAQRAVSDGQLVTPTSGIARPEDAGVRARTTINLFIPAAEPANITPPSPRLSAAPEELPPLSGLYTWNTPASLACVYRLVPVGDESCNPYVVTQTPSAGSRAIRDRRRF